MRVEPVSLYSYTLSFSTFLPSLSYTLARRVKTRFSTCTSRPLPLPHFVASLPHTTAMKQLSADTKHAILLMYTPRSPTHSLAALAARHDIAGGWRTIENWRQQWDGTPQSLQHKQGAGRPRALSSREVQQHVRAPILLANKAHKTVHYPSLLQSVRTKTGKQIALRTLQRYGKEELGVKQRRGKKRTADECESHDTWEEERVCVLRVCVLTAVAYRCVHCQCLPTCASRSRVCDASCSASAPATSSSSMRL